MVVADPARVSTWFGRLALILLSVSRSGAELPAQEPRSGFLGGVGVEFASRYTYQGLVQATGWVAQPTLYGIVPIGAVSLSAGVWGNHHFSRSSAGLYSDLAPERGGFSEFRYWVELATHRYVAVGAMHRSKRREAPDGEPRLALPSLEFYGSARGTIHLGSTTASFAGTATFGPGAARALNIAPRIQVSRRLAGESSSLFGSILADGNYRRLTTRRSGAVDGVTDLYVRAQLDAGVPFLSTAAAAFLSWGVQFYEPFRSVPAFNLINRRSAAVLAVGIQLNPTLSWEPVLEGHRRRP